MDDLTRFLHERLDEDRRRAERGYCSDTHWELFTTEAHLHAWKAWRDYFPRDRWDVKANDAISEAARDGIRSRITAHEADRTERTLRENEAKRRIINDYTHWDETTTSTSDQRDVGVMEGLAMALRLLALSYDAHPDYKEAWRP